MPVAKGKKVKSFKNVEMDNIVTLTQILGIKAKELQTMERWVLPIRFF